MNEDQLERVATIRTVVGFLGEKDRAGWWHSSFFATSSPTFLAPVFPRTQLLAQCLGVTAAAAKVHDERIGIGQVYHLFRLPEDMEQGIHRIMQRSEIAERIKRWIATGEAAMHFLRSDKFTVPEKAVGPTRIADLDGIRETTAWGVAAATYADGFDKRTELYPYFANRK